MDFSLIDYMDEDACYPKLVELLHPDWMPFPACGQGQHLGVHHRHREPVLDYQCGDCGRVFNAWTGTDLQGTHRRPSQLLLILHGVATGQPTAQMARELGCDRKHLLDLRHRLQEHARLGLDRNPLGDAVVEADEMYQNAGEKNIPHTDPADPRGLRRVAERFPPRSMIATLRLVTRSRAETWRSGGPEPGRPAQASAALQGSSPPG